MYVCVCVCVRVDRSEAAHVLLELGADAGVKDSDGQLCITAMIARMPAVVSDGSALIGCC